MKKKVLPLEEWIFGQKEAFEKFDSIAIPSYSAVDTDEKTKIAKYPVFCKVKTEAGWYPIIANAPSLKKQEILEIAKKQPSNFFQNLYCFNYSSFTFKELQRYFEKKKYDSVRMVNFIWGEKEHKFRILLREEIQSEKLHPLFAIFFHKIYSTFFFFTLAEIRGYDENLLKALGLEKMERSSIIDAIDKDRPDKIEQLKVTLKNHLTYLDYLRAGDQSMLVLASQFFSRTKFNHQLVQNEKFNEKGFKPNIAKAFYEFLRNNNGRLTKTQAYAQSNIASPKILLKYLKKFEELGLAYFSKCPNKIMAKDDFSSSSSKQEYVWCVYSILEFYYTDLLTPATPPQKNIQLIQWLRFFENFITPSRLLCPLFFKNARNSSKFEKRLSKDFIFWNNFYLYNSHLANPYTGPEAQTGLNCKME